MNKTLLEMPIEELYQIWSNAYDLYEIQGDESVKQTLDELSAAFELRLAI